MKKLEKREKIYIGIFCLALLWGLWNYRHLFGSDDPAAARQTPQPTAMAQSPPPVKNRRAEPIPAAADPDHDYSPPAWSGDPLNRSWRGTQQAASEVRAKPLPLFLSAVVVRPQARYAVINGKIIREGQSIAGRKVLKIEESGVIVMDHGVEVTLSL